MDARVRLAERLMEEAEHSSEAAVRASLSRAYYALHHLAQILVKASSHGNIRKELGLIDGSLEEEYGHFLELRQRADYDPDFVQRDFGGVAEMKAQLPQEIARARDFFEQLKVRIES